MSTYSNNRAFSDYVFKHLAIPHVYPYMKWQPHHINAALLEQLDLQQGIDAIALTEQGQAISIQYRFRDQFYGNKYSDVTLRYQREHHPNPFAHQSEFFKINADYLLYGVSNGKSFPDALPSNTQLTKWAIIDIKKLKQAIDKQIIIIGSPTIKGIQCQWLNQQLHCPINQNRDYSSSFVPFDVPLMAQHLSSYGIVVYAHGF